MTERRDDLLRRVVKAAAEGGLARRSLRDLAAQVGTSHRMLIHHFGSREGVLTAVVEAVERDQNERLGELPDDAAEAIRVSWRRTSGARWAICSSTTRREFGHVLSGCG